MSETIDNIGDNNDMVCEPISMTNYDISSINSPVHHEVEEENDQFDLPLGKFGFYTDDRAIFEARVARIEADIEEVKKGSAAPGKWIRIDNIREALNREHSWL